MGAITIGDEDGIAKKLWIKFRNESVSAIYTPFVVCLASGKLDSDSFLRCISQDVHFLQAFAQAYDLAEECADDDDDKIVIGKLRKRVLKKLKMHSSLVQGIEEQKFADLKTREPYLRLLCKSSLRTPLHLPD